MSIENAYLDYVQPQTAGDKLSQLTQLAEQQAAAQSKVADLEAQLNRAREELRDIAERQVPELMDQIGISEFKTITGLKIKIDEIIRASIPKTKTALALAWLKNNGHAAMIKRVVAVSFGKGEDERADELHQRLAEEFEVDDNASVHPSTLAAFVRERLRNGEEVPLDLFGVYRQRVSKIEV